ncbi:MAG: hypothetical protein V4480_00635 [Patescibacteria group bacterium]
MFVIDVIPLSRSAPAGVLSYRSRKELPSGTIVDITLRKKATRGIVVSCVGVAEAKAMLKGASFMLSGSTPAPAGSVPESIMQAAREVSAYQAASLGSVLATLFGEYVKSEILLVFDHAQTPGAGFAQTVLEQPIEDRIERYRAQIDAVVASGHAAMLVAPTLAELEFWKETFATYKPLVLSGALAQARRRRALETALTHTGLILATPSFSWTPIALLGAIIVDRVSGGTYTLQKRPYIDVVRALIALARARGIRLTLGDYPLPLEYRPEPGGPLTSPLKTAVALCDARRPDDGEEKRQAVDDAPWRAIPLEVEHAIRKEVEGGGRVLVLTSRTGYAPAVVCRDCGQAVVDDRGMPLSFATSRGARLLRSSDGKTVIDAKDEKTVCARCGSWNLLPLGVGMERAAEELHESFPNALIVSLATETLKTRAAALKALSGTARAGTIIVGTESLLPWLLLDSREKEPFSLAVIASADSLLALPFWRSRERFVRLAFFAAGLAKKLVVVTRRAADTAVSAVSDSSGTDFFNEEAGLRKALGYPPFGTLIVLHMEASVEVLPHLEDQVAQAFDTYSYATLPDRATAGRQLRRTLVLTLPEGTWPDQRLSGRLQSLPPSIRVHIDPESLW